ncbi:tetratricopeptide repeat protein [Maioricimonas rarisocia]|uniref:Tetratricopeptide repeat protein n=1 Tax=Maioricimonas rarisocia TaxID=2528026 RepID=A0A517ZGC9_9PLAN|nr:tetratricopeptide repeat protein [Maioricimonas rarisocia]QDU41511.1 tetratricopeptide repeat protein [Maioricimonas rarisocia]
MPGTRPQSAGRNAKLRIEVLLGLAVAVLCGTSARAADLDTARELAAVGEYEKCLAETSAAIEDGVYGESWHLIKAEQQLMLGRYDDAVETLEVALQRYSWSVRLRWKLRHAYRFTGESDKADTQVAEIARLVQASPWRYTDAENLIALGELSLDLGSDARQVQDSFFSRARRNNPVHRTPRLALGQLALEKRDYQLAAEIFREAIKTFEDDADFHHGLAAALMSSDAETATEELDAALKINPRHIPSLLLLVDRHIDAERYDEAQELLETVLEINEHQPEALAYQAVLAHLHNEPERERALLEKALSTWPGNPEVEHLAGRKLSRKYRFKEGAAYQRAALEKDPAYLPARKQLASDLLRLGRESEGWELVEKAFESDEYDVAMYNLITLREELERFTTLEDEWFIIRMDPHEAAVYGDRVRELLHDARKELCSRYGLELDGPVTVEIFPKADDFAVRTFEVPGVAGFLGVCFGRVITARSPALPGASPTNWESVLWHEFAHVVTLQLTNNRMPRWLSEGISVYEELQADPRWGQRMTPQYRQMILGGELTPVGELSSAFLSPKTPGHVQFAYYESSLVVEYIINEFGFESLLAILRDLGEGVFINDALERHTVPLEQLEPAFAAFARQRAETFAEGIDWSQPNLSDMLQDDNAGALLRDWADENPKNFPGQMVYADWLLRNEEWEQARTILERLVELYPKQTGGDSAWTKLAALYRRLGLTEEERELLVRYCDVNDADASARLRLIELSAARDEWSLVDRYAREVLAINPLTAQPHRSLALAGEQLDEPATAIRAWETVLQFQPADPADVHYRLASLHRDLDERDSARRHVLQALEVAPRYRDAHTLLLELVRTSR